MRKIALAVSVLLLFSCSKTGVKPDSEQVFYRDANVAISAVVAEKSGANIKLRFSSLYETNVNKIEVLSGPYENTLCFIHEEDIYSNSSQPKTYTITDDQVTEPSRVFVIRYRLKQGGLISTPVYRFSQ